MLVCVLSVPISQSLLSTTEIHNHTSVFCGAGVPKLSRSTKSKAVSEGNAFSPQDQSRSTGDVKMAEVLSPIVDLFGERNSFFGKSFEKLKQEVNGTK